MVSPPSKGLFDHAIIESGACALGVPMTEAAAETEGDALVTKLGCSGMTPTATLACMRAKPLENVLLALPSSALSFVSGGVSWGPIVDGLNVPADPTTLFQMGGFVHVPTLLGTNSNEGSLFLALGTPLTTDAAYAMLVDALLPGKGAAVVAHYPSATNGGPNNAAAASLTDGLFVCPARRVARALAGAGVPTYRYHFTHVPTNSLIPGLGAFHSSEIPFVFGNSTELEPNTPTAAEEPLAKTMMGYWGRMATAGDPNGAGATVWPKYDTTTEPDLVLDLTVSTETAYKKSDCDFWDMLLGL
jgi:para-nitrobenzyl esterase